MSTIKALGLSDKIKRLGLNDFGNNNNSLNNQFEEVYKIKLTTPLEEGSANEKDLTKKEKGMIYGNMYRFQVSDYIGAKPKTAKQINWIMSYYDVETGKEENLPIAGTGEFIYFEMNNIDTCGSYLYIRAYIKDKKMMQS